MKHLIFGVMLRGKEEIMKEYGKRCGLCRMRKESHMYFKPIDGKYIRLCVECWESVENKRNASCIEEEDGI